MLKGPAGTAGLRARLAINVRLGPGRIVIPDIVVADTARLGIVAEAADVVLVGEIISPSNAAVDRVLKMRLYAAAHIEWYLLVEPDMSDYESVTLRLFRLEDDRYVEYVAAKHGETLTSELPSPIEIDTVALLDF